MYGLKLHPFFTQTKHKIMIKNLFLFLPLFLSANYLLGQCTLNFGSTSGQIPFAFNSGSDIVNAASSGANESSIQSFDIWDEANDDCSVPGGADDITFDFQIIHAFDQYNVDGIIDPFAGSTHDITNSSSGLRGTIPMGNSSTNETSTGDVRGYSITVTFASHVTILAGDMTVNTTSINTAGEAHESNSVVFFDEAGIPYGTTTYDGYYSGTTGASTDGSCTAPPVSSNSWSTTGTGVFTASSTSTTDNTDPCNPIAGMDGPGNNQNINPVTDAGLAIGDRVGGFIYTVYLEDVAASTSPGAETTTSTSFTSTLNGIDLANSPLPVEFISFDATAKESKVVLNWSSASELNNDYFEIEWSNDGRSFESIGMIHGNGTTSEVNHYQFLHSKPAAGVNYYRLKQVDFDGQFEFSSTKTAKIERVDLVSIFPSIANQEINILKPEGNCEVVIYYMNGQRVRTINNDSSSLLRLDIGDLSQGSYIVMVRKNDRVETKRFTKI